MSYPSGPSGQSGNSGYPSGPPATQYSAPTQQFGPSSEAAPAGPSKIPQYLDIAVAALGLLAYLTTFALDSGTTIGPIAAILAGLLAGVGLVPKQKSHFGVVAVLAALGFLLILSDVITVGAGNADWPWYLLIVLALLQVIAAVAGLLMDAGVITAPVPKPKYEQPNPYGQYGAPGPYYGQPQHGGPTHQQGPPQRTGYPPQQYGGYQGGPSTGGFGPQPGPQPESGPPTPPTGFPAFGSPQSSSGSQPTQSFETQQPQPQAAPQSAPPPS
ncbi:DUF5336 domain-containing protein [Mycolicibacterium hodleri]|uniref:Antigen n=1 Tax=Mycolicibacterium hodleri TaxID=49897 RepID=A0A502EGF5_9MYCO|nr:DUF5336 domain-containing protein [Mycolicibacterium hodleri]TPG36072.1 hypothetical protein EAH80_06490 [Mycolicibacterium hodleri]